MPTGSKSLVIAAILSAGFSSQSARRVATPAPPPAVSLVPLPYFNGAHAIWGATGQDARGHIWFGVTTGGLKPDSAHLFEYTPTTGAIVDRGNVVDELQKAGILRPGENQAKIHSRIIQGPANFIYFASMDEHGENANGLKLPTWGGHLWRMSLATQKWEHLLTVPEALIAAGGAGRYVYALGYFKHILYQYDTQTGKTARLEVGSVDGHISRNFLVDFRGHVYVPRLRDATVAGGPRQIRVTLVEFGSNLTELRETPLESAHYLGGRPTDAQGIVGLQEMTEGSIYFTTHTGRLFRVVPPARTAAGPAREAAAELVNVGWLNPADGPSYPASLFTADGATQLSSAVRRTGPWEWLTCDVTLVNCKVSPLDVPGRDSAWITRTLFYGSATRDAKGGHYLVGIGSDYRPIAIRIQN